MIKLSDPEAKMRYAYVSKKVKELRILGEVDDLVPILEAMADKKREEITKINNVLAKLQSEHHEGEVSLTL